MITVAVGAVLGLLFLLVYERGVRVGMDLNKGVEPAPIRSPVAVMKQRKEAKETKIQDDKIVEGMSNIFSYEGKAQPGGETT